MDGVLCPVVVVASRGKRPPASLELTGFGGQLARLVPDWGTGDTTGGADNSPVLVGEAVVRLLRCSAAPQQGVCSCSRTCTGWTRRRER